MRGRRVDTGHAATLVFVFGLALSLRLIAVFQYADAPNFTVPIGDSSIYVERARAILGGDLLGDEIFFHSSPLYPYLVASVFSLTRGSFLALRVVQAVLGSLGCVVIALLAGKLSPTSKVVPLLAGLAAAGYGTLVFFDIDLLMIFLTIVMVVCCLLCLIRADESESQVAAALAGIALGVAASDKTNLLLFVPIAAWFLAGSLSLRPDRWRLRPALLFVAAVATVILPVTIRNHIVGDDLVLVSSNAGVNLYIGNNADARGVFDLPPASGLKNTDLEASSTAVAERALGRVLRPSRVSRFWAGQAWRFAVTHPAEEAALIGLKLRRLVNAYEVPNHLNLYYLRTEFVPALGRLIIGPWLIFPLGLAGICWRRQRGSTAVDRLLCAYLLTYVVSLLPFFVTARYRLPLVPVLIAYAAVAVVEILPSWKAVSRRARVVLVLVFVTSLVAVLWPAPRFGYSFNRTAMATRYYERATRGEFLEPADLEQAIIQLGWALETDPSSADAHYNLGVVYESVGYYSGAAREFQRTLEIDPERTLAATGLRGAREKRSRRGDRLEPRRLPQTPFEQARGLQQIGRLAEAERAFLDLIRRDPFHFQAYEHLAALYESRGDRAAASAMLADGVKARRRMHVAGRRNRIP